MGPPGQLCEAGCRHSADPGQAVIAAERNSYCSEFCSSVGLRPKAMMEIRRFGKQLDWEVMRVFLGEKELLQLYIFRHQMQTRLLQQTLFAGRPNRVARRVLLEEDGYKAGAMDKQIFIHKSSIHRQASPPPGLFTGSCSRRRTRWF